MISRKAADGVMSVGPDRLGRLQVILTRGRLVVYVLLLALAIALIQCAHAPWAVTSPPSPRGMSTLR